MPPRRPAAQEPYSRIYAAVRSVPAGKVATYGQIAFLAGLPGHARQVGYALQALPADSGIPWQRIVNARGAISPRAVPGSELLQRELLELEGVRFSAAGRVDLRAYGWEPELRLRRRSSRATGA